MYHHNHSTRAAQKVMVSMRDFFSKFDQIWRKFLIWLHLLKQSLMVKFIFVQCFLTEERKRKKEILTFVRVPCRKLFLEQKLQQCQKSLYPKGTQHKLNVHNIFRRLPGRLLNILCTFNLPYVFRR